MAAVRGRDPVVAAERGAHADGDRLLADVEVREAGHLRAAVELVRLLLEEADAASSAGTSRAQAPSPIVGPRTRSRSCDHLRLRRRPSTASTSKSTAKSRSPMPIPFAAVSSSFVTAVVGSGTSSSPAELEGEVHVLLHHVAVEPDLVRMPEHERPAVGDHRRGDHRGEHHLDRLLARRCPLFSASSTPSLNASICTASERLIAIFIVTADPLGPTWNTFGPIASSTGLHALERARRRRRP